MYAVGVGKAVEDELRQIASEPVEKHFFYTSDFTAINQIAENLKLNVCPGIWKKRELLISLSGRNMNTPLKPSRTCMR